MAVLMLLPLLAACGSREANSPDLARGQQLYLDHCAACHGVDGEGAPNWQEPLPNGTYPAPPHDSSGHTWHHPDAVLLRITAEGGSLPGSGMPGFKDRLSEEEMVAILDYIKTFWLPEHRDAQADLTRRYLETNR